VRKRVLFIIAAALTLAASFATVHAANQSLPAVGQVAPTFTLPSQDGSQISLSSFHGKWVVLYFYPKDGTTGCTIEAHNFQRDLAQYQQKNAVILGVSEDTTGSHQQFCAKEGLTFRLLADTTHNVATAYGSLGNFAGIQVANRNTFLIDPTGKIAQVWTKVDPSVHSAQVLAAVPTAKTSAKPSMSVKPPSTENLSVKPPQ
jgi:peroxiredoxin Q/BCP